MHSTQNVVIACCQFSCRTSLFIPQLKIGACFELPPVIPLTPTPHSSAFSGLSLTCLHKLSQCFSPPSLSTAPAKCFKFHHHVVDPSVIERILKVSFLLPGNLIYHSIPKFPDICSQDPSFRDIKPFGINARKGKNGVVYSKHCLKHWFHNFSAIWLGGYWSKAKKT